MPSGELGNRRIPSFPVVRRSGRILLGMFRSPRNRERERRLSLRRTMFRLLIRKMTLFRYGATRRPLPAAGSRPPHEADSRHRMTMSKYPKEIFGLFCGSAFCLEAAGAISRCRRLCTRLLRRVRGGRRRPERRMGPQDRSGRSIPPRPSLRGDNVSAPRPAPSRPAAAPPDGVRRRCAPRCGRTSGRSRNPKPVPASPSRLRSRTR